jgi:hypothetical protein
MLPDLFYRSNTALQYVFKNPKRMRSRQGYAENCVPLGTTWQLSVNGKVFI